MKPGDILPDGGIVVYAIPILTPYKRRDQDTRLVGWQLGVSYPMIERMKTHDPVPRR